MALTQGHRISALIGGGVTELEAARLSSYGRRFGSFLSVQESDAQFLASQNLEQTEILQRKGLFDLQQWNKVWAHRLHILKDGKPATIEGDWAESVHGEVSQYTATMISLISVLDQFAHSETVQLLMATLLDRLLGLHEYGTALLDAEIQSLVGAWRSASVARGLAEACRQKHHELIMSGLVLSGYFPKGELHEVADFLYWLLAENAGQEYGTSSSDVFGIALCLLGLGFDRLSVKGRGFDPIDTECRVFYSSDDNSKFKHHRHWKTKVKKRSRWEVSTIPLDQPEGSFTTLPIKASISNYCRLAWKRGKLAADSIRIRVKGPELPNQWTNAFAAAMDLRYEVEDLGTEPEWVDEDILSLTTFAFVANKELCDALSQTVNDNPKETVQWLLKQVNRGFMFPKVAELDDACCKCICTFQAFWMGYIYGAILPLVDTSTLTTRLLDGAWGYLNFNIIYFVLDLSNEHLREGYLPRERILTLLAMTLLGDGNIVIPATGNVESKCLGIIGVRSLLCNSLIKACRTPEDIAGFTLLDVDTCGIPRDHKGLIRCGTLTDSVAGESLARVGARGILKKDLVPTGPKNDLTKHIEPDWNGNPQTMLLTLRFEGRRIGCVNPSLTDVLFCQSYVAPIQNPALQIVKEAFECTMDDFRDGKIKTHSPNGKLVIIQAYGRPCMRYAAAGWVGKRRFALATNCIQEAINSLIGTHSNTVIAGEP